MLNALSVDLENWYDANLIAPHVPPGYRDDRIEASTRKVLDLLGAHRARATFFVLGEVAQEHPALVEAIRDGGHEIASHGWKHKLVYRQTEEEFESGLKKSLALIEKLSGKKITGFRAPSWSVREEMGWFFDVLIRHGIIYDSSFFPVHTGLFGAPGCEKQPHLIRRPAGDIIEIPASAIKILGKEFPVAGGASLRLLPLAFTLRGIFCLHRRRVPAIVYFHPWELDENIPFPALPGKIRLLHQRGAAGMEKKLGGLLERFRFGTMGELAAGCNRERAAGKP